MEASEKFFRISGKLRQPHGGRSRLRLIKGSRGQEESVEHRSVPATDDPADPERAWANRREAELRGKWQSEWRHNGLLFEEEDQETVAERIRQTSQETLRESLEQVPGLRDLYTADPETGTATLDPKKCEAVGEATVHRVLEELISARLGQDPSLEVFFPGRHQPVGMHLSTEHPHMTSEQTPTWRSGLVYTDPAFSRKDGVEMIHRRGLLFDPNAGRFVCQEISRPWSGKGNGRGTTADGTLSDGLRYSESPSDILDVISAIGLVAEAPKLVRKPAE